MRGRGQLSREGSIFIETAQKLSEILRIIFTVPQKRFERISGYIKLKIAKGKKNPYLPQNPILTQELSLATMISKSAYSS